MQTPGYLVWRLSMKWRAAADRALAPLGLTHAQYALLASLYGLSQAGREPSQRELADYSGLEPIFVSKLARALEGAGLLRRSDDPADSRAVRLTLTGQGADVVVRAVAVIQALQDENTAALGGIDSPRTRELMNALRTLLGQEVRSDPMPQARPLTGEHIGEAQRAVGAIHDVLLDRNGLTFDEWVAINSLTRAGGAMEREDFHRVLAERLYTDRAGVARLLSDLLAKGLVSDGTEIALTGDGKTAVARHQESVNTVSAELYEGLDEADLATARRVLQEVTDRAQALRTNFT